MRLVVDMDLGVSICLGAFLFPKIISIMNESVIDVFVNFISCSDLLLSGIIDCLICIEE